MSYQVRQGDIFGRVGSGIGQGLAEQLPKEMSHQRLSSGLKELEKDSANLSPQQFYTRAASIYGISPAMLQALPEIAKLQAGRNASFNEANQSNYGGEGLISSGKSEIPSQTNKPSKNANATNQGQQINRRENPIKESNRIFPTKSGLTTYSPIETALGDIREPTRQELVNKKAEILNRNKWMSDEAAEQQAIDYFQRLNAQKRAELEKGSREENLESKIEAKQPELRKSLGTLGSSIPEESYDRAVMRQQYNVANGMTPTQAANHEKKNMMNLARAYNSLKNNIGTRPLIQVAGSDLRKSIKDLKPAFKENDELPLFKNTLVNNLDIGDHLASFETWNPGKGIQKEIINTSVNDDPIEIASRIGKHLNGNDNESLFATGYLLNKIGVDDENVIKEVMNLSRNGLVKLSPRQMQEGSEYYPVKPKLEDDFFTAFGGLLIGPILKYISGQREKVGTIEKLKRRFGGKE